MEQKDWKPCPFVDGNSCRPDCPLWGETVVPVWILPQQEVARGGDLDTRVKAWYQFQFKGCLLAAGMLALVYLANRTP